VPTFTALSHFSRAVTFAQEVTENPAEERALRGKAVTSHAALERWRIDAGPTDEAALQK
jgi:hypothetical protein